MNGTNIIVGAGQAGAWAAVGMRQAGFQGRILLIGEEPHRPYERPPLSKQVLTADAEPPVLYFHKPERYAELAIELMLETRVTSFDPERHRVALGDGRSLAFDRLLLATGGRARRLDLPGGEHLLYLRTLDDARRLRAALRRARRVVCIGAGVIGLEIAASACTIGAEVTVLEATPAPMGRALTPEVAAFVVALHRAAGVELRFGIAPVAIAGDPDRDLRVLDAAGGETPADLVVAGIGMERNVELAAAAGLELDGGIAVDAFGRTSAPDIYAAGDVAAFMHPRLGHRLRLESWRHAQDHGLAVGRAMAAEPAPYDEVPWFWTDQHGVNLQIAGVPTGAARTVVREGASPEAFTAFHLDATGAVVGVSAAGNPRDVRAGQALIRAGRPVDPAALADPAVPLQRIAAAAR